MAGYARNSVLQIKKKKKAGGMTVMYLDGVRKVLKESFGNHTHLHLVHFTSCTNNYRH